MAFYCQREVKEDCEGRGAGRGAGRGEGETGVSQWTSKSGDEVKVSEALVTG